MVSPHRFFSSLFFWSGHTERRRRKELTACCGEHTAVLWRNVDCENTWHTFFSKSWTFFWSMQFQETTEGEKFLQHGWQEWILGRFFLVQHCMLEVAPNNQAAALSWTTLELLAAVSSFLCCESSSVFFWQAVCMIINWMATNLDWVARQGSSSSKELLGHDDDAGCDLLHDWRFCTGLLAVCASVMFSNGWTECEQED